MTARGVTSWVLLVLAWLCILAAVLAVWTRGVLLDSDRFVALIGPILRDERVVTGLSERVGVAAVSAMGIEQRVREALPDRAGALAAGPVTLAVQEGIDRRVQRLLGEENFQRLLADAVRVSHRTFLRTLRGDSSALTLENGTLTLDLVPLTGAVLRRMQTGGVLPADLRLPDLRTDEAPGPARRLLEAALGRPIPPEAGQVQLLDAPALAAVQQVVGTLDVLALVLPLLALASGALAVWLAPDRRRATITLAVGSAVLLLLVDLLLRVAGPRLAAAAGSDPLTAALADSAASQLVISVARLIEIVAVVALLGALVAFFVEWRRRRDPAPDAPAAAPGTVEASG